MLGYGVKEETSTTGTGNLTVSAVTGFPRFSDVFGTDNYFYYSLIDSDGKPLESGIGHLSATSTLVRDQPIQTYVSSTYDDSNPSAVSLSGTTTVVGAAQSFSSLVPYPDIHTSANHQRWHSAHRDVSVDTKGLQANRVFFMPFLNLCTKPVTGVACYVTASAGTGSNKIRTGLYTMKDDGQPGNLLDESGDLAPNTTGWKDGAFAGGVRMVPPGWLYVAVLSDTTPTLQAGKTDDQHNGPSPLGMADSSSPILTAYDDITSGWSAMPTTLTWDGQINAGASWAPMLFLY